MWMCALRLSVLWGRVLQERSESILSVATGGRALFAPAPVVVRKPEEQGRILYLDGWRAVAISEVMASHAFTNTYSQAGVGALGRSGVYIFFLISGFIITSLTMDETRVTGSFNQGHFIVRRCLRILPPLLLYAVAMLILSQGVPRLPWFLVRSVTFTCNIGLGNNALGDGCGWLFGHTWSLAFEEQFYLLFPFIITRRLTLLFLPAAVLYALPLMFPIHIIGRSGFAEIAMLFSFGAAYAVHYERMQTFFRQLPILIVLVLISSYFIAFSFALPDSTPWRVLGALLTPPAFFLLVFVLPAKCAMFKSFIANPLFARIGLYSYSMYLWQEYFFRPTAGQTMLYGLEAAVLTLVLSAVSYHTYERLFRRLSRRFSYRHLEEAGTDISQRQRL